MRSTFTKLGLMLFLASINLGLQAQTFTNQTGALNPFNGVTFAQARETAVDIDGDGVIDVFAGTSAGTIRYFKNTGTKYAPVFTEQTGTANPLNGVNEGYESYVKFVDIDGDGVLDAFITNGYGYVFYYKNTGTKNAPVFTKQTGTSNPLSFVSIGGWRCVIDFVDIDGDGDMDAFIGNNDGGVQYFKNTGTKYAPVFVEQTGTSNPLSSVAVGNLAAPAFVDINNDGVMDVFVGAFDGTVSYYKNIGTTTSPSFAIQTGTSNPLSSVSIGSGNRAVPAFADLDGDGDQDVLIGSYSSNMFYYKNGSTGTGLDNATANALSIYPNPTTDGFTLEAGAQTIPVTVFDLSGALVLTQQATGKSYIDITSLKNGVYVVKANGLVTKLVKK